MLPLLDRFIQGLRHGARMFVRNPALTAIAVVSIAFSTGAKVAIFSVAEALLLRPLPVLRPSELLTVGTRARVTAIAHVLVRLIIGMGVMGVMLTVVGLYWLVSYSVSRRTREIGIRIAIGTTYRRIVTMVLRQGMTRRDVAWRPVSC